MNVVERVLTEVVLQIESFFEGKTSLGLAALSGFLSYVITETYYTTKVTRFLSLFADVPVQAPIYLIWDWLLVGEIPPYVLEVTAYLIPMLAFVMSILKFLGSDNVIEELSLGDGIIRLQQTDIVAISLWLLAMVPVAILVNYPLTPLAIIHGGIVLGMQLGISLIPTFLISAWALPMSTRRLFLKTRVFLVGLLLGGTVITAGLFLIRLMTCWVKFGGCTLP